MKAAMGLNTSLIEDVRVKRRIPQPPGINDCSTLGSPSFTVTQALVGLLAKAGGLGMNKLQLSKG